MFIYEYDSEAEILPVKNSSLHSVEAGRADRHISKTESHLLMLQREGLTALDKIRKDFSEGGSHWV